MRRITRTKNHVLHHFQYINECGHVDNIHDDIDVNDKAEAAGALAG